MCTTLYPVQAMLKCGLTFTGHHVGVLLQRRAAAEERQLPHREEPADRAHASVVRPRRCERSAPPMLSTFAAENMCSLPQTRCLAELVYGDADRPLDMPRFVGVIAEASAASKGHLYDCGMMQAVRLS